MSSQWGNGDAKTELPAGVVRSRPHEYHRPLAGLQVRPLGFPDSYAPMVGHSNGWPVGYDPEEGRAWLTHCYGYVGVGRDLAPDTGTGGELYAVIGHAPRHLDLNIAVIGRVVEGMALLSARPRGTEALGFYKAPAQHIAIARARLAARHARGRAPRLRGDALRQRRLQPICHGPRQSRRRLLPAPGRRRRHLQRAGAGEEGWGLESAKPLPGREGQGGSAKGGRNSGSVSLAALAYPPPAPPFQGGEERTTTI